MLFIRDSRGHWCNGFYCISYATNPLHAELLAIRHDLHTSNEQNYSHLISALFGLQTSSGFDNQGKFRSHRFLQRHCYGLQGDATLVPRD